MRIIKENRESKKKYYVQYFSSNALLGPKKKCRMALKKHKNKNPSGKVL